MKHSINKILVEVSKRILAFVSIPFLLIYIRFKKITERERVWLIGENRGIPVNDNGYHFFLYCAKHHPDKNIFFLCQKNIKSEDDFLRIHPKAIIFGSLEHYYYLVCASVCFYTHEYRDILYRQAFRVYCRNKKLVYLHHGVLGLKKFDNSYLKNKNVMDIFTIAFDHEREILINEIGVDSHRIRQTGYARLDDFCDDSSLKNKEICYFPTFRIWDSSIHKNTGLQTKINSLIHNPNLLSLLESQDAIFTIFPHVINRGTYFINGDFSSRIRIAAQTESAGEVIKRSNLMISDYSSVSWDFALLNKPVIYYRFDLDQYSEHRGSYLDLKKEIAGEIVYTEEELLNSLGKYFENHFTTKKRFKNKIFLPRATLKGGICADIYKQAKLLE